MDGPMELARQKSMLRHPANTREMLVERAEGLIDTYEKRVRAQVNTISRLIASYAVHVSDVPEGGTRVLFKLADAVDAGVGLPVGQMLPYLEIASSEEDSEGRIIITLRAIPGSDGP